MICTDLFLLFLIKDKHFTNCAEIKRLKRLASSYKLGKLNKKVESNVDCETNARGSIQTVYLFVCVF